MPRGDFAGWFEAYIGGRWYTFDARNNIPRIGRLSTAQGRDATDVPITVRLFGSRVDDARRGGDIDLHVQVDDDAFSTMACRVRYLSDLEVALGERKVDLVVEGPTRKNGYIDRIAQESRVLL